MVADFVLSGGFEFPESSRRVESTSSTAGKGMNRIWSPAEGPCSSSSGFECSLPLLSSYVPLLEISGAYARRFCLLAHQLQSGQ